MRPPRRLIVAASIAMIAALLLKGTAVGNDVADITVSESETVTKDYGPIASPEPPDRVEGVACCLGLRSPDQCRSSSFCDTIDLDINVPASYTGADFFRIDITLTWADPNNLNDLDLYLHKTSGNEILSSRTAKNPEKISLQDPPDKKYLIVVSNRQGPNSGYRVSVTFVAQGRIAPFELDEEPSGSGSKAGAGSSPSTFDSSDFSSLPSLPPALESAATGPRSIESPGPDGPGFLTTLAVLGKTRAVGRNSNLPFILSSAIAVLAAAALATFLIWRGRRESEF